MYLVIKISAHLIRSQNQLHLQIRSQNCLLRLPPQLYRVQIGLIYSDLSIQRPQYHHQMLSLFNYRPIDRDLGEFVQSFPPRLLIWKLRTRGGKPLFGSCDALPVIRAPPLRQFLPVRSAHLLSPISDS